ncbi:MAG TPA: type I secretion system permease/ATPase [Rubrivivax sp.]|nr:type I secretion system permease/ATPase [Rubrivivax sp.]
MNSFVRTHAGYIAAAAGFSLLINLALLAPSLFMLQVFDRVLSTRSPETLVMLSLVTALALLLMFALDGLRGRLLALLGGLFERSEGRRVLQRVLDDAATLEPAQQAYALRDVGVVRAFLSGAGIVSLFDAPWMVVYVALIAAFSPLLGMLALASCVVLVVLAWLNEGATRKALEQAQQSQRDLGQFVDAALRSPEVVRALGMAPALGRRWEARSSAIQTQQLAIQRVAGWIGSGTRFFRQSVQVVMMGTAGWMVIQQQATAGVMIAVTIILGRALAPVESLIAHWKSLVEARAAWRRLRALDATPGESRFAALPQLSGALAVSGVSYAPPRAQHATVRNVSVEIARGEVLAIIGPSGSGKSTLARLMLGVIQPGAGQVSMDGAALSQWDPDRLGAQLGYLPQEVALFSGSIAENIARFDDSRPEALITEAAQLAQAHELIVNLPKGYDTQVGDGGRFLSGGQRQRVGLARALYGNPRVVVLDEPNAYLDHDGELALGRAIGLLRQRGSTVVVITQRTQVLSLADRIMVMRDGAVERIGVRQDKQAEAQPEQPLSPAPSIASIHGTRATGA